MDRAQLADFLRTRREALQPEDVGLPRGPRRRTGGLRREEVSALAGMSADYYGRIEQQRGPTPSEQMLAALAATRAGLQEVFGVAEPVVYCLVSLREHATGLGFQTCLAPVMLRDALFPDGRPSPALLDELLAKGAGPPKSTAAKSARASERCRRASRP